MLPWLRDIEEFIFLNDTPASSDIIFVPGNGHALPSEHAAFLYHQGFAPLILPSGKFSITAQGFAGQLSGARPYKGDFKTEWDFMHHILRENGVPEEAILREDEATYTYQNAILSRRLTDAQHLTIHRAILCCMPVHARRASMYYQTLYPDTTFFVCPAPHASMNRNNWLDTPEGIDTVLGELERCGSQFHSIVHER